MGEEYRSFAMGKAKRVVGKRRTNTFIATTGSSSRSGQFPLNVMN